MRRAFLHSLTPQEVRLLSNDWHFWARDDQLAPEGDWTTWLVLGGRGAGKTRAGAEWVQDEVTTGRAGRIALIGETFADAREVMIDGPSGLRAIAPPDAAPKYEITRKRLLWPNGAVAYVFSAGEPDSLRGPQFDAAWGDELAKWRYAEAAWDMLQFGLRLGERPRQVMTTTPRPMPLLKRLHDNAQGDVVFPFLVLGENDTRNWPGGMEHRLSLHCFSRSGGRMEAKSILGAVHAALDDKSLTLEGHTLINLRFLDSTTRREADGTTWRGTIRFRAITENGETV